MDSPRATDQAVRAGLNLDNPSRILAQKLTMDPILVGRLEKYMDTYQRTPNNFEFLALCLAPNVVPSLAHHWGNALCQIQFRHDYSDLEQAGRYIWEVCEHKFSLRQHPNEDNYDFVVRISTEAQNWLRINVKQRSTHHQAHLRAAQMMSAKLQGSDSPHGVQSMNTMQASPQAAQMLSAQPQGSASPHVVHSMDHIQRSPSAAQMLPGHSQAQPSPHGISRTNNSPAANTMQQPSMSSAPHRPPQPAQSQQRPMGNPAHAIQFNTWLTGLSQWCKGEIQNNGRVVPFLYNHFMRGASAQAAEHALRDALRDTYARMKAGISSSPNGQPQTPHSGQQNGQPRTVNSAAPLAPPVQGRQSLVAENGSPQMIHRTQASATAPHQQKRQSAQHIQAPVPAQRVQGAMPGQHIQGQMQVQGPVPAHQIPTPIPAPHHGSPQNGQCAQAPAPTQQHLQTAQNIQATFNPGVPQNAGRPQNPSYPQHPSHKWPYAGPLHDYEERYLTKLREQLHFEVFPVTVELVVAQRPNTNLCCLLTHDEEHEMHQRFESYHPLTQEDYYSMFRGLGTAGRALKRKQKPSAPEPQAKRQRLSSEASNDASFGVLSPTPTPSGLHPPAVPYVYNHYIAKRCDQLRAMIRLRNSQYGQKIPSSGKKAELVQLLLDDDKVHPEAASPPPMHAPGNGAQQPASSQPQMGAHNGVGHHPGFAPPGQNPQAPHSVPGQHLAAPQHQQGHPGTPNGQHPQYQQGHPGTPTGQHFPVQRPRFPMLQQDRSVSRSVTPNGQSYNVQRPPFPVQQHRSASQSITPTAQGPRPSGMQQQHLPGPATPSGFMLPPVVISQQGSQAFPVDLEDPVPGRYGYVPRAQSNGNGYARPAPQVSALGYANAPIIVGNRNIYPPAPPQNVEPQEGPRPYLPKATAYEMADNEISAPPHIRENHESQHFNFEEENARLEASQRYEYGARFAFYDAEDHSTEPCGPLPPASSFSMAIQDIDHMRPYLRSRGSETSGLPLTPDSELEEIENFIAKNPVEPELASAIDDMIAQNSEELGDANASALDHQAVLPHMDPSNNSASAVDADLDAQFETAFDEMSPKIEGAKALDHNTDRMDADGEYKSGVPAEDDASVASEEDGEHELFEDDGL